jgi:hypothetical protein
LDWDCGDSPCAVGVAQQPFFDRTHDSKVFGEARHYRILLPPAYETSGKRYPVNYYFHGHSDRYTVENYDNGTDTIPKMADWVAQHDAIVVCVDGYVASEYTGFYGGTPWDVMESGGDRDFGRYFLELIQYIDSTYRTLTDRRHRATSGLSMGGFIRGWIHSTKATGTAPGCIPIRPGSQNLRAWRNRSNSSGPAPGSAPASSGWSPGHRRARRFPLV